MKKKIIKEVDLIRQFCEKGKKEVIETLKEYAFKPDITKSQYQAVINYIDELTKD